MGDPASDAPASEQAPAPAQNPPAPPAESHNTPPAKPAPPAASKTVLEGEMTERELKLQKELEEEKAARAQAEKDAQQLQGEADQLRGQVTELQTRPVRVRVGPFGIKQELKD